MEEFSLPSMIIGDGSGYRELPSQTLSTGICGVKYTENVLSRKGLAVKHSADSSRNKLAAFNENVNNFHEIVKMADPQMGLMNIRSLLPYAQMPTCYTDAAFGERGPVKMSDFDYRWHMAKKQPPLQSIANLCYITLPTSVNSYIKMDASNVNICFGGMDARPFEGGTSRTWVFLVGGKLGTLQHSGIKPAIAKDTAVSHISVFASGSHMFMMDDDRKKFCAPDVIAGSYIDGKGRLYVNQDVDILEPQYDYIMQAISAGNYRVLGSRCIIAMHMDYNLAVDPKQSHHPIHLGGYFSHSQFLHILEDCPDFSKKRETFLYCDAAFANHVFKFAKQDQVVNMDNITHDITQEYKHQNFICAVANKRLIDKKRGYVYTANCDHVLGPQVPGLYAREQSMMTVSEETENALTNIQ